MQLQNLSIDRIIIHQIFQRDENGKTDPIQSHEYIKFDKPAMDAFKKRVVDALGEGSKSVCMQIIEQKGGSLPKLIDNIIDQDDESFAVSSYDVAKKLNDSQQSRSIPGGIVVVFTGKHGFSKKSIFGIIKADMYSGYEKYRNPETNEISLNFVEEILLTPASKLYKTAAFFERAEYKGTGEDLNDKWMVLISDFQISKSNGKAAAKYFHYDFLGCGYWDDDARLTKRFYDSTSTFIRELEMPVDEKSDCFNALAIYLKVDTSPTINVSTFSDSYFHVDMKDDFINYMEEKGVPLTSFSKNITHIKNNLKFRKVSFGNQIKITAPPDTFKESIVIKTIDGTPDELGIPQKWTNVVIKDIIVQQE